MSNVDQQSHVDDQSSSSPSNVGLTFASTVIDACKVYIDSFNRMTTRTETDDAMLKVATTTMDELRALLIPTPLPPFSFDYCDTPGRNSDTRSSADLLNESIRSATSSSVVVTNPRSSPRSTTRQPTKRANRRATESSTPKRKRKAVVTANETSKDSPLMFMPTMESVRSTRTETFSAIEILDGFWLRWAFFGEHRSVEDEDPKRTCIIGDTYVAGDFNEHFRKLHTMEKYANAPPPIAARHTLLKINSQQRLLETNVLQNFHELFADLNTDDNFANLLSVSRNVRCVVAYMLDRLIDCGLLIYSIPQTIAELMRNPLGFKTINDWSSLRYEYYGATKTTKLIHTPEEEEIELLRRFFNEQVNGKNYRFMNSGLQNSSTLGNGGVRDSLFDEPLNSLDDLVPRTTTSVQDVDEMLNLYLPADFMDEISDSFVCLVRDTEDLDPERPFHQRSASYLLGQNVPDVDTPDNTNIDSTDDESADNATSHSNSSSANSTVSTSLLGKRNSTTVLAVVKTVSSAKSRKAND